MTGRANQCPGKFPAAASGLGRLGLIPFIALTAGAVLCARHRDLFETALAAYSFGILSFLLGAWWGLALIKRHASTLLISNVIFLVVFFSYFLLTTRAYLATSALMFLVLLVVEHRHPMFRPQPAYYARMRVQLSLTAALALLLSAAVAA
ncbi:DUF3429 family protein [Seongchinamella unica]|uniref:DUF3429 family protein n=1 Tax=Seongchinamella unica TaxID=2547392 RepID=A0A4R5LWW8_9GAMM|nr:DUF3429 domain-containing protein [Seongchinamella unica]TDG15973.1 DUF3429 family protein [Seongchinamella unica]